MIREPKQERKERKVFNIWLENVLGVAPYGGDIKNGHWVFENPTTQRFWECWLARAAIQELPDDVNINKEGRSATEEDLVAIFSIVNRWIIKQGGFSNGYETWVKGVVELDLVSRLDWCTPKAINLTKKQTQDRGTTLYTLVLGYMKTNNITDKIEFVDAHQEHGCFKAEIRASHFIEMWWDESVKERS